ncbi:putative DNA alkylation repair protein [Arthrobacter nitrophenolicus]|uniref:Putative DNA alkylation repair protein n=1 Tax=Arthrobacter nitrophenolicus TaxID=683150 RepID=L8TQ47_9MICC|nr:putative DNA alkylation repair protein [Arthrobacter nitrophenolicus]
MNELINAGSVRTLTRILGQTAPAIRWDRTAAAASGLDRLVLRARTDLLAGALVADIAGSPSPGYATAARSFRAALQVPEFTGWFVWPVSEAAVTLALDSGAAGDFDDCLALMAALTPRLTSEFAVRRLLARDPERALAAAREWADSADEHVRRLASEGTRPYLPWAVRVPSLIQRPQATIPILDALYRDPSEYVRRSVANHLNDLARHAPDPVVDTARRWLTAPDANTARLVRHGLRTLVKKGHPDALALLGFTPAGGRQRPEPGPERSHPAGRAGVHVRRHQHRKRGRAPRPGLPGALPQSQRPRVRQGLQDLHRDPWPGGEPERDQAPCLPADDHQGALSGCPCAGAAGQWRGPGQDGVPRRAALAAALARTA